jgi:hypothetical protein
MRFQGILRWRNFAMRAATFAAAIHFRRHGAVLGARQVAQLAGRAIRRARRGGRARCPASRTRHRAHRRRFISSHSDAAGVELEAGQRRALHQHLDRTSAGMGGAEQQREGTKAACASA